jgi:hypothetical protein
MNGGGGKGNLRELATPKLSQGIGMMNIGIPSALFANRQTA